MGTILNIDDKAKVPEIIFAEVGIRSDNCPSMFETNEIITSRNVARYRSNPEFIKAAARGLRKEGFKVLFESTTSINIGGSKELYESIFETKLLPTEREVRKHYQSKDDPHRSVATYWDSPDTDRDQLVDTSKSSLKDVITGVAIDEPMYFFEEPNSIPPQKNYWHLNVFDVSEKLNANRAHEEDLKGEGINVVMVDTGWYQHPFFTNNDFFANVILGPGTEEEDPKSDDHGHGTGESANLFSVAPKIDLTMIKMTKVNPIGALNMAISLQPDIISCSWGTNKRRPPISAADQSLAAAVANAVSQGITVIYAAGNSQYGFPGQHPDVISAGGVYMHKNNSYEASSYASGFESLIFPGRKVPDVCGLVGMPPKANYIMLPVQKNCFMDRTMAGGTGDCDGDETNANDGWAAFSGTSAAAPQIAGICALMKQVNPNLTPETIKDILKQTARDVTQGSCSDWTGEPAQQKAKVGPDVATGNGLVDAYEAVLLARNQNNN